MEAKPLNDILSTEERLCKEIESRDRKIAEEIAKRKGFEAACDLFIEDIAKLKQERDAAIQEIAELKEKLHDAEIDAAWQVNREFLKLEGERDDAIQLIDHLGSWKDKDRHCYDLTNPEAQVQPIIDKLDAAIQSLNNITHIKDELALELKAANAKDAIQRAERLEFVCLECGCPGEFHPDEQVWRHKDLPWIDSSFCNKNGYPIKVGPRPHQVTESKD